MERYIIHTRNVSISDEDFFNLCVQNKEIRFERDKHKNIIIMSPSGFLSSNAESEVNHQLRKWNETHQLGYVTSPSGGFYLPDSSMRAPDAAWVEKSRIDKLTDKEKQRFPYLCPDFVIEVKSPSESLVRLKEKMEEWIENGCRLAWLIDIEAQRVHIYRKDGSTEIVKSFTQRISGEDVLPGFVMELKKLKQ